MDYTPKDDIPDMSYMILGSKLGEVDQAMMLRAFQNRYTGDHTPDWADSIEETAPLQFVSDAEWLATTRFAVSPYTGKPDRRIKRCVETPTWPDNPIAYGRPVKDLPRFVQARMAPNLRFSGWNIKFNLWLKAYLEQEKASALPVEDMTIAQAMAENRRREALGLPSLAEEEEAKE